MLEWAKKNDALGTVNRGDAAESGLCTLCRADCKGKCEVWMASLRGRELLYPRDFGDTTSGSSNTTSLGVGYHALRIQGGLFGAQGLPAGVGHDPDNCFYKDVDVTTSFGRSGQINCRAPMMTGALGSTAIARKYWPSFATGAAIAGIPLVVGENVAGIDPESKMKNGTLAESPEMDRRIETYRRYHDGHGAIIVQVNVEDSRNGVPQYLIEKHGDEIVLELKWGQGAKDIGGEIQVEDIEYARFLKDRGYFLDPDPYDPEAVKAFEKTSVKFFARHSRLGATNLDTAEQVHEDFMSTVEAYRKLGFTRLTLKTGSYGMQALAMSLRYAAEAELELVTIDGSGGGTGMSPWNMMEHWGVPSLPLHSKAYEYCRVLEERGIRPPDVSFAGGFAREDHIFKAIALGAPYVKLVCMGRALMIPGFVGSNVEGVFHPERRAEVNGHWEQLPAPVASLGVRPDEIFTGWETVRTRIGDDEMERVPYGAIALVGYLDKLSAGLQQFMAGARKYNLSEVTRSDLMAANRETAAETGIPYLTDAYDEEAQEILRA